VTALGPEARRPACEVRGVHHVAFAHRDGSVDAALQDLFGLCPAQEEGSGFTERNYDLGSTGIQTLEATGPGTVERFVERRGAALHHIAIEVEDIDAALASLEARGVPLVDRSARTGPSGTRIAFVHPSAFGGLLVELVETHEEQM